MQVLTCYIRYGELSPRHGELCAVRPVTLTTASQELAWRAIEDNNTRYGE
jgi:hypothetical protein